MTVVLIFRGKVKFDKESPTGRLKGRLKVGLLYVGKMASINSAKSEALSLTIKLRNQTSCGGRWPQMALKGNFTIRNNLITRNKYWRDERVL